MREMKAEISPPPVSKKSLTGGFFLRVIEYGLRVGVCGLMGCRQWDAVSELQLKVQVECYLIALSLIIIIDRKGRK
jgi:hypothetical protein